MSTVTIQGAPFKTVGELPAEGSKVPDFKLTSGDLTDRTLADFKGKKIVFNIFPSIDTGTCAASVRRFNAEAASLGDSVAVLCISRDLPFAQARFCGAEGLDRVVTLSSMKDTAFGDAFGVTFVEGPLEGLFSRSVVIADASGAVIYAQQVPETSDEPDYESAMKALKA